MTLEPVYIDPLFSPPTLPVDFFSPIVEKVLNLISSKNSKLKFFLTPYLRKIDDKIIISPKYFASTSNGSDVVNVIGRRKDDSNSNGVAELTELIVFPSKKPKNEQRAYIEQVITLMPLVIFKKEDVELQKEYVRTFWKEREILARKPSIYNYNEDYSHIAIYVAYSDDEKIYGLAMPLTLKEVLVRSSSAILFYYVNEFAVVQRRILKEPKRNIVYLPIKHGKVLVSPQIGKFHLSTMLLQVIPKDELAITDECIDECIEVYGRERKIVAWNTLEPPVKNCPTCDSLTTEKYCFMLSHIKIDYTFPDKISSMYSLTWR